MLSRQGRPVMNSSSLPTQNETPKIEHTSVAQPLDVGGAAPRPKSWSYMHRIKWAGALPVKGSIQRTAMCIADHINERTGQWSISAARMADETNTCERTIRSHVDTLRAFYRVEDRPGLMWRIAIPAPFMRAVEPRQNLTGTPAKSADVPCKKPSEVHTQGERERLTCEKHGRSWPKSWGPSCYECARERQHGPKRMARAKLPARPNRARTSDSGMSERINAARVARMRAERGMGGVT